MPEDLPDEGDDLDDDGEEFEDLDYDEDDTDQAACPHCGAAVYDDADRCPECGMNIVKGHDPGSVWPGRAPWDWPIWIIIATAVLAIAAVWFCLL